MLSFAFNAIPTQGSQLFGAAFGIVGFTTLEKSRPVFLAGEVGTPGRMAIRAIGDRAAGAGTCD
jgi:hypothetical protein